MARKSPVKKKCKKSQTRDLDSKRCRKKKSVGRKSLKRKIKSKRKSSKSKRKSKKVKSRVRSKKRVVKKKKTASSYFSTKLKGVGNGVDDRTRVYYWLRSNREFAEKCQELYKGFNEEKVKDHSRYKGSDGKDDQKYFFKEMAQKALKQYNKLYSEHFYTSYNTDMELLEDQKKLVEAAYYYMFIIVLYLEYKDPATHHVTENDLKELAKETTDYKYRREADLAKAGATDDDLELGTIVTLINPKLDWQKNPETIIAYYSGKDNKDGKRFFTIKEENDEFVADEAFDPVFHIKHDGMYKIEPKQSDNIEEILLKNKQKLNWDPPVFDFSSYVGILKKGEIGVFTGIIMCIGVVMHNKRNGDSLAFHYVVPDAENQDNRQKAFETIKDAMISFKWDVNDCKLHLFMQNNEATKDAVNEARLDISRNFSEYEPVVHILYNRLMTFQHDDKTDPELLVEFVPL
jgi:hypothetical protein